MCDVGEEERPCLVGNLPECFVIDVARISACSYSDHLWLLTQGDGFYFIIIDTTCFFLHAVRDEVVQLSGEIDRRAVCKMSAVREIHPHHFVPRLDECKIDRHVCLGAGVWLDICVFGAEELL